MKVLLLEIPSANDAFEGRLVGNAIGEIFDLLKIEKTYKLILSKKIFIKAIEDISYYDLIHIECHSDEEGICYNPLRKKVIDWVTFAEILAKRNDLKAKQLVISGCLAGNINSKAKALARRQSGFKRVFAFDEKIAYDKAIAVWSGFYYLLSESDQWSQEKIRSAIRKLRDCYNVKLVYFYHSSKKPSKEVIFPKKS